MIRANLRKRNNEGYVEKKESTIILQKSKSENKGNMKEDQDKPAPKIRRQKTSDKNQESNEDNNKSKNKKIKKTIKNTAVDLELMKDELQQLDDPPVTIEEKKISSNRLTYDFFNTDCEELAVNLLGKILVRRLEDGTLLKGKIVETESYLGEIDKASMTYQNKVTQRNLPMYMEPGTIFVYLTYGMYHCFNISSKGKGSSVFLRAVEPLDGTEKMILNRQQIKKNKKIFKTHELTNGPAKLCMAFNIKKEHTKYSLCSWKGMWIENSTIENTECIKIVKCTRIGIESVGSEWASKNLRYYIFGNSSVSKRDKKAEDKL